MINNQYISEGKIIVNNFNNYFVNVRSSLAKHIQTKTDSLHYIESLENSIHIPEINMDEVRTIISAITNSASGYDELPASILKQCIDSYLESLTHLINLSISLGIVPDELKVSRVIPIQDTLYKTIDPFLYCLFFSKSFEEIVPTCVIYFLDDNMLFYKCQFGFRKNNSTSYAIMTLVERVTKALDTGKYVVGVFLTLKK